MKNTKNTSNFNNNFNMGIPVKIFRDVYSNQLDRISLIEGSEQKLVLEASMEHFC